MYNYNTLDIYKIARELSATNYYQSIFGNAKTLGLRVFENVTELTTIQVFFLNHLNFYSGLNTDIVLGDVSKRVTENFIFEDAYTVYKRKKQNTPQENLEPMQRSDSNKSVVKKTSSFVFRRKLEGE